MEKYIRTKDGIFKVIIADILGALTRIDKRDGTYPDIDNKEIIKEANTIEELCDEFVIVHQNPYCTEHYLADEKTDLKATKEFIGEVYGAIWTDKGLIYVAKMNDKGEFELL